MNVEQNKKNLQQGSWKKLNELKEHSCWEIYNVVFFFRIGAEMKGNVVTDDTIRQVLFLVIYILAGTCQTLMSLGLRHAGNNAHPLRAPPECLQVWRHDSSVFPTQTQGLQTPGHIAILRQHGTLISIPQEVKGFNTSAFQFLASRAHAIILFDSTGVLRSRAIRTGIPPVSYGQEGCIRIKVSGSKESSTITVEGKFRYIVSVNLLDYRHAGMQASCICFIFAASDVTVRAHLWKPIVLAQSHTFSNSSFFPT
ncbi:hypothetical protein HPP92_009175 [Vanilla planifolia]|uniref:Uncharacterized protein n=1 Tax=Vanilla planifolia TaxID=51239 RepID=A0A835RFC6_VANPL|nr:hypothetical protein HPP92_009175 [Vanilla planifolia]